MLLFEAPHFKQDSGGFLCGFSFLKLFILLCDLKQTLWQNQVFQIVQGDYMMVWMICLTN